MSGFIGYTPDQYRGGLQDTVDTPELIALYKAQYETLVYYKSLETWKEDNIGDLDNA